ncbi:hypothetical protein [Vreelandella populi]|uniref:hypothetical protein n=2 Tax=Halomonadaceae TaxID=28256 RepID=UPI00200D8C68|nr:hypothetical protein [Halomonas populi]
MSSADCQRMIDELDRVLKETRELMTRFEETGMNERMERDYDKLHDIYSRTVKDQWHYTQALLALGALNQDALN